MQPEQPEPLVSWAPPEPESRTPPREGEPVGELHDHRSPSTFTLGDAIKTGIGLVGKPSFVVPVLVIGIIVNAVVAALIGPLIPSPIAPGQVSGAQIQGMLAALIPTFIFALIGGILMSLYGQIWVVDATSGPFPSPSRVFGLAGQRWIGVIGTGIAVALLTIATWFALVAVSILSDAVIGGLSLLLLIPIIVIGVWVNARLSMATWLAADGASISNSIRGSWRMTRGQVLRIVGWGLAYGILFGIIGLVLGELLSVVPFIGAGVTEAVSTALGYGAGVTLYRRTQADALPEATARPGTATQGP